MSDENCGCGHDTIPCFRQVVSELSAALRDGFLPEAVGRDPDEEWEIYCGVRSLLPKEPRCTATAFVGHFMKNTGMEPVGEHAVDLTRAAAVIGILARLDSALFTRDEVTTGTVTRPGPALWRSEDGAEPLFPELGEVLSLMGVPTEGERKNLRGTVIVRGVYRMMRGYYLESGKLPSFEEVEAAFGITTTMPLFPLCFLAWAEVKNLQTRIVGQMNLV